MSLVRLALVNQISTLPTDEETFCEPDKDHRLHAHSDTEHTLLLALPVLAADPWWHDAAIRRARPEQA